MSGVERLGQRNTGAAEPRRLKGGGEINQFNTEFEVPAYFGLNVSWAGTEIPDRNRESWKESPVSGLGW